MADRIQVRRDTDADWTSNDPTLASGEIGFVSDTNELVVGDGSTAYTSLSKVPVLGTSFSTYTPSLTGSSSNPTLGSGATADGRYYQIGKLVVVHVDIKFGTSSAAGSGTYSVSLPVSASTSIPFARVGSGLCRDDSASASYVTVASIATSSTVALFTDSGQVGAASPFAWGDSDFLRLVLMYEAA